MIRHIGQSGTLPKNIMPARTRLVQTPITERVNAARIASFAKASPTAHAKRSNAESVAK